jgi:hypothetical protein
MSEFDPSLPVMVHDRLNDRTFEWKPATMQANYEKYAKAFGPDVIEWDGLLLDGWLPLGARRSAFVSAIDQADAVFRHVCAGSNSPFWLSDHHFRSILNSRHSRPRPALRKRAISGQLRLGP